MRASLILLLLVLVIDAALEWYILRQIRSRVRNRKTLWWRAELWSSILFFALLVAAIIVPAGSETHGLLLTKMWLLFTFFSTFVAKLIAVIFDLLASVPRLFGHKRIKALTVTGIALALIIFLSMWWGALINRFRIDVNEVTVEVTGLPQSFDGYRIVQFSDLHTGTYGNDTTFVSRLVDRINGLHGDAIMFTGDIINSESVELTPFISPLSRLKAPDGVFAILGNHDYGDYTRWETPQHKVANMDSLFSFYRRTGMDLLRNETRWIRRGGDSIAVIGVENIGEPPFPVYGSLTSSYPTLDDDVTKILLTHNPRHWVDSIQNNDNVRIQLALSGHTHAMQIEVGGVSPASLRYETWGGLYADSHEHHQLYVNIGAGTVGIPMRIGATPEITVITLRRRK
ncbi:MAG: metallophosphoesterase [Muribaculaceae bacterium]